MSFMGRDKEEVVIHEYEEGVLYEKGVYSEVLGSGLYRIAKGKEKEVVLVDRRNQSLHISGQEILTKDNISVRVNVIARFRVSDARKFIEGSQNSRNALYEDVQMAIRDIIKTKDLEEALQTKDIYTNEMKTHLGEKTAGYGIEVESVDLKDIVAPAQFKNLLMRKIAAKKEGEIALEKARSEVAAARALANAAKLVSENPDILELKMIEALGKLAESKNSVSLQFPPEMLRSRRR